ncbi:MAG: hypothetical protein WCA10_07460 [Terracidiphilus sp.]
MAGNYLRGAFIQYNNSFPLPVPNLILFQYNPETMTHTWTPAQAGGSNTAGQSPSNPLAVIGPPEEAFSFNLVMDSNDTIADKTPGAAQIAEVSGVYPRLAALEMLLFPVPAAGGGLVGAVSAAISSLGSALGVTTASVVPAGDLPIVFFIWGPGRIAPVRVDTLTITETLYDSLTLNPVHASAQIGLKVLTAPELQFIHGASGTLARAASTYSMTLREALAVTNLVNSAESIAGMLPF